MRHAVDHVFVTTPVGAHAADALVGLGFTEGPGGVHPGQGTANRRFFFRNAMLEFLWVCNANDARSALTRPTRLWERCERADAGICPFGLCLRPSDDSTAAPFAAWPYRPRYLPGDRSIDVAANSEALDEPMLFHLAFGARPDSAAPSDRHPTEHATGVRELTRVRWMRPSRKPPSAELRAVVDAGLLDVGEGDAHVLELGFDDENGRGHADLRPALPLVLRW